MSSVTSYKKRKLISSDTRSEKRRSGQIWSLVGTMYVEIEGLISNSGRLGNRPMDCIGDAVIVRVFCSVVRILLLNLADVFPLYQIWPLLGSELRPSDTKHTNWSGD